jgi:hypothetical protein
MDCRLVGGRKLQCSVAREKWIIPEKVNQSKGLLPDLTFVQVFERTGFFRGFGKVFHTLAR